MTEHKKRDSAISRFFKKLRKIFRKSGSRKSGKEGKDITGVSRTAWLVRKVLEDMRLRRNTGAQEKMASPPDVKITTLKENVAPHTEAGATHAEEIPKPKLPLTFPDEKLPETIAISPKTNEIQPRGIPATEDNRKEISTMAEEQVIVKLGAVDQQENVTLKEKTDSSRIEDPELIINKEEIKDDKTGVEPEETLSLSAGYDFSGENREKMIPFETGDVIQVKKNKKTRFGRRKDRRSGIKTKTGEENEGYSPEIEIEEEKRVFGRFELKKAFAQKVEEYDSRIHGPLVDLVFKDEPGIDEVEVYPVNEPYAYVRITFNRHTHEYNYAVIEPEVSEDEEKLLLELRERLYDVLDTSASVMTREESKIHLRLKTDEIIQDYGIRLDPVARERLYHRTERDFLGEGLIDAIMHDPYIEDISCDGVNSTIFVYHKHFESMRTNLKYTNEEDLDSFVVKLAQRAGKFISIADPMLDATMKDGSRVQMTLGTEVTAHGSTYTIRKFSEEPITPTDLIEWSTFSPLSMAFLWLAVESGKSAIFAGGTASGKTTTLNALALFIPPLAKIVSLEDTRELQLPHPNWIPSITRHSFGSAGRGEIDMYELLRAALRQRPEYILVGEVRGHEALTLFQAMSTGHVTYATMHADSVASAVHRLENSPIDVPRNMLSALDFISIQVQSRVGGQRIRRNKQIIEVIDLDPRTNELITNEVFTWHQSSDEIRFSGKSYILEEIMEERAWTEERMAEELKRRQEVLEWMRQNNIRHFEDVSRVLVSYYRNPEQLIETIRSET